MDFKKAVLAHSKWKVALKDHIEGGQQINPEVLGRDDQCDLGKWLSGEGKTYQNLSAFNDLKAKHQKFHEEAAKVARSARIYPADKALAMLDPFRSEFGHASSAVINALTALSHAIGK